MKKIELKYGELTVPAGYMRFGDFSSGEMCSFIHSALENGVNHFDHADIYAGDHILP